MGHWCSHVLFQTVLTAFYQTQLTHPTRSFRSETAMCEPATTVHPHEHLQTNAHSKPNRSSQNISNTSDLWGMGIEGQSVSQVPSAIYQAE